MNDPEETLRKRGLHVIKVKMDTGASVDTNASIIKYELEVVPNGMKVVLIGHSKVQRMKLR